MQESAQGKPKVLTAAKRLNSLVVLSMLRVYYFTPPLRVEESGTMTYILTIYWTDGPESEEEFDSIDKANSRISEIEDMPWTEPCPSWDLYSSDGEFIKER